MKEILLLIRSITLLFRESQLETPNLTAGSIVKEVAETVRAPEMAVGSADTERDMVLGLRSIAIHMASEIGTKYVADDLLQKVRLLTRYDESLHDSLREGVSGDMPEEHIRVLTGNIRRELTDYLREVQALNIIKEQSRLASFNRESITNLPEFIANFRASLEQFETSHKEVDPAIVGEVMVSDIDHVESIFEQAKELNTDVGIMKTGWQAINRMLQGGLRRGEEVVIGALQHNFKTGFTLSLFKHIPMYNTPYMIDKKKKPLIVRISFEDPLSLNFPFLYRNIKENQNYEYVNVLNTSSAEMSATIKKELSVNGYEVILLHVNPSLWGYRDVINYTSSLEAAGYEIHLAMLDYANMLSKRGLDTTGPTGSNIRELFRVLANHYRPRRTTLVTPHQLSTEAKMLIRQGAEENFVKDIANKGYYDGCRTLDQEVDLELYIHKVIADSKSWLCVQRGKHRTITQVKEEYKYTVLPFYDIGDLRDDINGPDMSSRKPGGVQGGRPESRGFWDFDKDE